MWSDLSPAERRAFLNTREDLSDLLEDLDSFLDEQADAEYFTDRAAPVPNAAMSLQVRVKQVIEDIALSRRTRPLPSLTPEELSILRTAPHSLSPYSNIAYGYGYHVYGLARRGYLERTHTLMGNSPAEDVSFYHRTAKGDDAIAKATAQ